MASVSVGPSLNSRLSGTDAKPLKIVTFSEDLSHPGVHHTAASRAPACRTSLCALWQLSGNPGCSLPEMNTHVLELFFV